MSKKVFEEYFKFGFVRNPWDWQVSLYTFMLKDAKHHQHEFVKSLKDFDEYIDWRVHHDLHLQKSFFYEENNCLMDFIGKFENINEDFSKICDLLGIQVALPYLNRSREDKRFTHFYSQKSIDMIYEAFKEDIELFNYTKPQLR